MTISSSGTPPTLIGAAVGTGVSLGVGLGEGVGDSVGVGDSTGVAVLVGRKVGVGGKVAVGVPSGAGVFEGRSVGDGGSVTVGKAVGPAVEAGSGAGQPLSAAAASAGAVSNSSPAGIVSAVAGSLPPSYGTTSQALFVVLSRSAGLFCARKASAPQPLKRSSAATARMLRHSSPNLEFKLRNPQSLKSLIDPLRRAVAHHDDQQHYDQA